MKKRYPVHRSYFIWLLFFLSGQVLMAQTILKGKINDEATGEPLIGAIITQKSTNNSTVTDIDGAFSISIKDSLPVTLVLSYISYLEKEIEVFDPEIPIEVTLKPKLSSDEVVVIGYGTTTRQELVGSVSKIEPKETSVIPVASVDAQLQGKAAGVQINSQNGIPGDAVVVKVRGAASINASTDPLYVVDGIFINNETLSSLDLGGKATSPLADINPADIESIEVLKDASATAIYGSRGASGVIIITTKRGNYEQKPKVSFNTSQGWARAQPSRQWKLTTGPEHAQLVNEAWINTGIDDPKSGKTYANRPFRPVGEVINGKAGLGNPEDQQTYDRLNDLFRTARLQNYDLSLQGGSKNTRYYIGTSYTDQEAIIRPAYYKRGSFKINLDQKVNDRVSVGTSNTVSYSERNQVRAGTGTNTGIFQAALHTPTYQPKNRPDGTPSRDFAPFDNLDILINEVKLKTVSLRYIGNLYLEAEILPNLKVRTSNSIDYNNYDESEYNSDKTAAAASSKGRAVTGLTQNVAWINEQTINYKKTFARRHNLGVLIGNTLQSNTQKFSGATGTGFPNNSYTQMSSASVRTTTQTWTRSSLSSFFSRLDYNFNKKYFLEASLRADGSSKFGDNNRWGYFPAVGGAWNVKQENFLKGSKFLSDLKIRASYGIIGNQNGIDDFAARGLWQAGGNYPNTAGASEQAGTTPKQLANPDLKWEKTRQFDAGFDLAILNNRVAITTDFYYKYTTDLLLPLQVPAITGFNTYFANSGEVSNKGIEFSLNTVNVQKKNFSWKTNFNIARNVNKIEKLATPFIYGSRDMNRNEEGYALYSFWMYKQLYVDANTGKAVFEDLNGDGQITVADRQIVGNASPKFFGGFTNTFTYKGWDAGIFFTYQYGNKVVSFDRILNEGGGTKEGNRAIFAANNDRWQKPGDQTDVPRTTAVGDNYGIEQNSRFLEDGSFVRLKTLTIGYSLPAKFAKSLKLENLRVYFVGANLWIYTRYKGPDPESTHTSDQNARGIDVGTPPQPQSVQLGINITL